MHLLNDVGQIYVRNKKIDTYIAQLRDEMNVNSNDEQFISLLGKYNALVDVREKKHKQILDTLLSTKQQAEELATYPICDELEYLKGYLEGLELVLGLIHSTPTNGVTHIITLWGVEFDHNNEITALFVTDSDDYEQPEIAMKRMLLKKNSSGQPVITTNINGNTGAQILEFVPLSLGEEYWNALSLN